MLLDLVKTGIDKLNAGQISRAQVSLQILSGRSEQINGSRHLRYSLDRLTTEIEGFRSIMIAEGD